MEHLNFQEHKNDRLFYFNVKKPFIASKLFKADDSLNCSGCNECRDGCFGRCGSVCKGVYSFSYDTLSSCSTHGGGDGKPCADELNACEGCDGCGTNCSISPY